MKKLNMFNLIICIILGVITFLEPFIKLPFSNMLWGIWFIIWGLEYAKDDKKSENNKKEDKK